MARNQQGGGVAIRLSVRDGETARKALEQLGKEGEAALKRIERAGARGAGGRLGVADGQPDRGFDRRGDGALPRPVPRDGDERWRRARCAARRADEGGMAPDQANQTEEMRLQ